MRTDTIAAIATGMSNSGIGIVRISGGEAFAVIDRIFRNKAGKPVKLSEERSHTVHYGFIYDGDQRVDEALVVLMRGPRSFTAEDTVEIDCHGGVLMVKKILETVIRYGARTAEPGEFTKRAFLNGRIDLSQAEAVADVINAKNDYALRNSVGQLSGSVSKKIKELRAGILYQIAFIESALDDPEHISLDGFAQRLCAQVGEMTEQVEKLIRSADDGRVMTEGVKTVILGKPNAGKSSLMNVLIGEDRAMKAAREADLLIYVVDGSTPLDENDREIMDFIRSNSGQGGKKAIVLLNKTDLETCVDADVLERETGCPVIPISAKEEQGIGALEQEIKQMFYHGALSFNDEVYITSVRHKEALGKARESLEMVKRSVEQGLPEDFYSIDLMDAYEQLGLIIGEAVDDDVVNEIFAKFCMGK